MFTIIVSAVICFVTVSRSISRRGRGGEFDETNLKQQGQGRGQVLLELAEQIDIACGESDPSLSLLLLAAARVSLLLLLVSMMKRVE